MRCANASSNSISFMVVVAWLLRCRWLLLLRVRWRRRRRALDDSRARARTMRWEIVRAACERFRTHKCAGYSSRRRCRGVCVSSVWHSALCTYVCCWLAAAPGCTRSGSSSRQRAVCSLYKCSERGVFSPPVFTLSREEAAWSNRALLSCIYVCLHRICLCVRYIA